MNKKKQILTPTLFSLLPPVTVAYVASQYLVNEANRIFGEDGWSSTIKSLVEDYVRREKKRLLNFQFSPHNTDDLSVCFSIEVVWTCRRYKILCRMHSNHESDPEKRKIS